MKYARECGDARWKPTLDGVVDTTRSKSPTSEMNFIGALGEMAVCRHYGFPFLANPFSEGGDKGYGDIRLDNGVRIEVKTTRLNNENAMQIFDVDRKKMLGKVHVIVATRLPMWPKPIVEIVGWAPWPAVAEYLKDKKPVPRHAGWYPSHWIPYAKLRHPDTLLDAVYSRTQS